MFNMLDDAQRSFDSLVSQSCEGVLSRMDKTKFRDDVSPEMVLNLIIWMSDGYMHCHVPEQLNDVEAIYNDYPHLTKVHWNDAQMLLQARISDAGGYG